LKPAARQTCEIASILGVVIGPAIAAYSRSRESAADRFALAATKDAQSGIDAFSRLRDRNLAEEVTSGGFRQDLYFRLNVVHITMPLLRDRKEDIPLLVRGFLLHFCKVNEKPLLELTADAMNALLTYNWPGNVRELRTAIEHGVVMARGTKMTLRDLPPNVRAATGAELPGGITPAKAFGEKSSALDLHETEKRLIMQALATTNGNITKAAQKLGISRRTLHRKINELKASGESL